jgi:Amt family ammonium transporter
LAGAIAERLQFKAYIVYILVISGLVYPIIGHWIWGGGWLSKLGFFDFAGSTVVHSVGGMSALAVAILLGPRVGKFKADGSPRAIPGHNLPLAGLGAFILWLGWFGFNAGSNLAVGDGKAIGLITLNTTLAAAAGAISAMFYSWIRYQKPDLGFTLNGSLAGLVGITAPCAFVSPNAAIVIGLVAGVLVCLSVAFIDRMKIDDAVGAISVHGTNGIWGTLAVGIWGQKALGLPKDGLLAGGGFSQLGIQLVGSLAACVFVFAAVFAITYILKVTIGIRAHHHEEQKGLDISEHGTDSKSSRSSKGRVS